jgi:hypothetical protein
LEKKLCVSSASNNLDTWFYAVFNEELSAYWGHPNFINAWPAGNQPYWHVFIDYNVLSPVISYGGQYAMTFSQTAALWVMEKTWLKDLLLTLQAISL